MTQPQLSPAASRSPLSAPAAVFVDAGWLFADAGLLVSETRRRNELPCKYAGLLQGLTRCVDLPSGALRRLRTCWHDAASQER